MTTESEATHAPDANADVPIQTPSTDGLLSGLQALWEGWRGIVQAHLQLLGLEAQRAAESLSAMLAYGLAIGFLLVSAWLALAGAFVWSLVDYGYRPATALLVVVLLNGVGVMWLAAAIRRRSQFLRFPATMRILQAHQKPQAEKGLP